MARFYTNENIALAVVQELRRLGKDVLTTLDAGKANAAIGDADVLVFATTEKRILITHNRRHFLQLIVGDTVGIKDTGICGDDTGYWVLFEELADNLRAFGDVY